MCMCDCLSVLWLYMCHTTCVEVRGHSCRPFLAFLFKTRSLLFNTVHVQFVGLLAAKDSHFFPSFSQQQCCDYRQSHMSSFYVGSGDLNTGPRACVSSTLSTELTPQTSTLFVEIMSLTEPGAHQFSQEFEGSDCLCLLRTRDNRYMTCSAFYIDIGDIYSGPHACMTRTFLRTSLQSLFRVKFLLLKISSTLPLQLEKTKLKIIYQLG